MRMISQATVTMSAMRMPEPTSQRSSRLVIEADVEPLADGVQQRQRRHAATRAINVIRRVTITGLASSCAASAWSP